MDNTLTEAAEDGRHLQDNLQLSHIERDATQYLLNCLEQYPQKLPPALAAGAALKVSVLLARELSTANYPRSCRQALENILSELDALQNGIN